MVELVPFRPFVDSDEVWYDIYIDKIWKGSRRTKEHCEKVVRDSILRNCT